MVDYLTQLLIEYKYWIVIAGALLEGEVVLLIAGGAAYHGYVDLPLVMLISFVGAMIHDHLLFFIGRGLGARFFLKFPTFREKFRKVFDLFHKYHNYFILGFRFVYGLRTITPVIIGTSHIHLRKYSTLTLIAGIIWAISISYIGYMGAIALQAVIESFERCQKYFALAFVIFCLGGWIIYKVRKKNSVAE
jgi:membrane protein DedA with SNARE-associated domain